MSTVGVIDHTDTVPLPAHVRPITCDSIPNWRRARVPTLGGSSIAKLFGVGGTPLELYAEKVMEQDALDAGLPLPEEVVTEQMELGTEFEPTICAIFAKRNPGMSVVAPPPFTLYRNERYPLLHASPDRFLIDVQRSGYGVLEAKSTGGKNLKEWEEEPPLKAQIQAQQYMLVLVSDWAYLNAVIGTFGFTVRSRAIEADKLFQELILEEADRFKRHHLDPRVPPAPTDPDDYEAAKRIYRAASNGKAIELAVSDIPLVEELVQARALKASAEQTEKVAAAKLLLALGDAEMALLPDGRRLKAANEPRNMPASEARTIHTRPLRVLKAQKGGAR